MSPDRRVGLLVIASAAIVLVYGLAGKPVPISDDRVIWASFPDAAQLGRFDRDVRVDGVNVGRVAAVKRAGDIARLELRLRPDVVGPMYADASAELRPHTVFDGSGFVDLDPGTSASGPLGSGGISVTHTRNAISLDHALRTFTPLVRRALPQATRDLRRTLDAPSDQSLRQTLRRGPELHRALAPALRAIQGSTRDELAATVEGYGRTAQAAARADAAIGPLLRSTAITTRALDPPNGALDLTLARMPSALRATATGARRLRRSIAELRPLAQDLRPAAIALTPMLRAVTPWLRQATPVLRRISPFADQLRRTLRTARRAAPATTSLLRDLLPISKTLDDKLVPFLLSDAPYGGPTYESLGGLTEAAAGILSPAKTLEQGARLNAGAGHGWHMTPSLITPTKLGCATIPAGSLRARFSDLGLCAP